MQAFIEALEKIEYLDPEDCFGQIFRFFEAINKMDRETVIAAWQTYELFCYKTGVPFEYDRKSALGSIRESLIGRMNVLIADLPRDDRNAAIGGYIAATDLGFRDFRSVGIRKPESETSASY